ncbi:MAG: hypothetical protein QF464_06405, partial [Myxococcota bacterium]|nr:hypothetical protein [Myxococcota bacterium]
MKPLSVLAAAMLALTLSPGSAHAKSTARLTALHVAPVETKIGLAIQGLNSHSAKASALTAYMTSVGLEPPNITQVMEKFAHELGMDDTRKPLPESIGLAPGGTAALYVVLYDGRPRELIAIDVADKRAFIAFLKRQEEQGQWVEEGEKPKKARVKRKRLKNGVEEITVALPGRQGETVHFKGSVAVHSQHREVLDLVAWKGTPIAPAFKQLSRDPEQLTVAIWARPGELLGATEPEMRVFESVSGHMVLDGGGMHVDVALTLSDDAAPFAPIGRPGTLGAKA